MVVEWILGALLLLASLGVILARKPVYAGLYFLVVLLLLSALYLQLSAQFIAIMQILVYAGAILVIFMFVIILFQDAHQQLARFKSQAVIPLLSIAAISLVGGFLFLGQRLIGLKPVKEGLPEGFGNVEPIAQALYVDFFFPFEAIIALFLIALIGALYVGRKG